MLMIAQMLVNKGATAQYRRHRLCMHGWTLSSLVKGCNVMARVWIESRSNCCCFELAIMVAILMPR